MDMIWYIVGGVAVALGIGGFLYYKSRPPKEEPLFYFNCPHCKRKLRYRARQAGHSGTCPQCRKPLAFPKFPM